jgi:S1-C subfamily serine protease
LKLPAAEGVLVVAVEDGSPADRAGIEGGETQVVVAGESYQLGGDMIVAIDGKDVTSVDELRREIAAHAPGDKVRVTVVHADGERETVTATLGRQPTGPGR